MAKLTDTQLYRGGLSVFRCGATGAIVAGTVFGLCWIGAAMGWLISSHMYVALFTVAPVASADALGVGLCWSLGLGALGGALIALAYNALAFLDR